MSTTQIAAQVLGAIRNFNLCDYVSQQGREQRPA